MSKIVIFTSIYLRIGTLATKAVAILILIMFFGCIRSAEPETFLIPSDYRGSVKIIYDSVCGVPPSYENERRLYHIDHQGILIIDLKPSTGFLDLEYYFMDENENRTRIQTLDKDDLDQSSTEDAENLLKDEVAIFEMGSAGNAYRKEDRKRYRTQSFIVSTYNDLKKYKSKKYLTERDSLIQNRLKDCN